MARAFLIVVLCLAVLSGAVLLPSVRDTVLVREASRPGASALLDAGTAAQPAYMEAFLSWVGGYVMNMLGGFVSSEVAAIDRTIAGRSQLTQARMNQAAAESASGRFAAANDVFNIAPERTCRTVNEAMEARLAMSLNEVNKKAVNRQMTARLADGGSAVSKVAALMEDHADNYCSASDVDRGKCANLSTMQNADVTASTLFLPEGSDTLSKEQYRAASAFINMATVPVPIEDIPKGVEGTAAGQRYLLEKKHAIAVDSMVAGTFARALAARSPRN